MRSKFLVVASLCLCGCGSMAQEGAMLAAYRAYEDKDYSHCVVKTSSAELYGSHSRVMDAQIMFYKSLCLEGMGQREASIGILERLARLYPDTDWGAAAARKLAPTQSKASGLSV